MRYFLQNVELHSFPVEPLTQEDCNSILEAAYSLFCEGKANAVGVHDDRHYVLAVDCEGSEYFVGRMHCSYYLFDRAKTMIACRPNIADLLADLRAVFTPTNNLAFDRL